ncbi:MAG: hypothetical protein ICV51_12790 [Flavisolibacter sp.]|nr:hypothetical protein [Flavisolibacter sp.]MBD0376495.1 hypothetical protein [Flavisolibacter sp.]
MEKEASHAAKLTLELEDMQEMYEQGRKEVARKQEKIDEAFTENQRLKKLLNETEDKLQEANLQRQQLTKKIRFLEEINSEFEDINEANKKLQTELRRLGELESKLSIMTEEKNILLGKHRAE